MIEIHQTLTGKKVGRKYNVEVLNKGAIVLLDACLEAYVEDLATEAFGLLIRRAKSPDVFPIDVRRKVSKELRKGEEEKQKSNEPSQKVDVEMRMWDLAGEGWKNVLKFYKNRVLERHVGQLNTPNSNHIDALFASLLAIKKVSRKWSWHKTAPGEARARLDDLIALRGDIAHRVSTSRSVRRSDVERAAKLVTKIAVATHNTINDTLKKSLGCTPWKYGPI